MPVQHPLTSPDPLGFKFWPTTLTEEFFYIKDDPPASKNTTSPELQISVCNFGRKLLLYWKPFNTRKPRNKAKSQNSRSYVGTWNHRKTTPQRSFRLQNPQRIYFTRPENSLLIRILGHLSQKTRSTRVSLRQSKQRGECSTTQLDTPVSTRVSTRP